MMGFSRSNVKFTPSTEAVSYRESFLSPVEGAPRKWCECPPKTPFSRHLAGHRQNQQNGGLLSPRPQCLHTAEPHVCQILIFHATSVASIPNSTGVLDQSVFEFNTIHISVTLELHHLLLFFLNILFASKLTVCSLSNPLVKNKTHPSFPLPSHSTFSKSLAHRTYLPILSSIWISQSEKSTSNEAMQYSRQFHEI